MKFVVMLSCFLWPATSVAEIRCTDGNPGGYIFSVTASGDHFMITGDQSSGRYTGHCNAVGQEISGRIVLMGTDEDQYLRKQCFAEIRLGVKYMPQVSVPSDQTWCTAARF
jgi:hypothetical protein